MAADRSAASWAAPLLLLRRQEALLASSFDGVQVLDHAHVIFCAVAFIQAFQAFAGVISALKTGPNSTLSKQITPA